MRIDIFVGAFPHHRQHQLGQAEKLEARPLQRLIGVAVEGVWLAVESLARQFTHLDRIVPVDPEDHALGLDLVLDLRGFPGIVLQPAPGLPFRVAAARLGFAVAACAGRLARKRAR